MWHYIKIVQVVIGLLPVVTEAIRAAEAAIPGQGRGEQKLAMIREMLESAHRATSSADVAFVELWPALERAINRIVAAWNEDGTLSPPKKQ